METKFTKGEWICPNNPETDDYVWVQQKGFSREVIAHIHRVDKSMTSREESIANLKLILAAPDLFNALLDIYKNIDELSCEYFTKDNPLFVKAKEALNKAGLEV